MEMRTIQRMDQQNADRPKVPEALVAALAASWEMTLRRTMELPVVLAATLYPDKSGERRVALKQVLTRLGEDVALADSLSLPHPRFSLTHARPLSVAIGLPEAAAGRCLGLGIDFEPWERPVRLDTASLFLSPEEQRWLASQQPGSRARLQLWLWTLKEALFKADPENATQHLKAYEILDLGQPQGLATRGAFTFRYCQLAGELGGLSVAWLLSHSITRV
jgi:hypothetical protein